MHSDIPHKSSEVHIPSDTLPCKHQFIHKSFCSFFFQHLAQFAMPSPFLRLLYWRVQRITAK